MATCPRCRGHLTDSHVCPSHPVRTWAELIGAGVAGGLVGQVLVAWLDPRGQADMDLIAIFAGALIAIGAYRAFRR
jgi:uncharacterized membrane protein YeaQ/YmgE (transglycosylase-associated protein family)